MTYPRVFSELETRAMKRGRRVTLLSISKRLVPSAERKCREKGNRSVRIKAKQANENYYSRTKKNIRTQENSWTIMNWFGNTRWSWEMVAEVLHGWN